MRKRERTNWHPRAWMHSDDIQVRAGRAIVQEAVVRMRRGCVNEEGGGGRCTNWHTTRA